MQLPATLALLRTKEGAHALRLHVAQTFRSRLRGLMFARPLPSCMGLLITRCTSVHTCFMRYPIDLVYLSAEGEVTRCVAGLAPWRWSAGPRRRRGPDTRHVLELPAGSIERLGVCAGDRLLHPLLQGAAA